MSRESNRPESYNDLKDYQRQGHSLFNWYADLGKYPTIEQHIVKAKIEAARLGFEVTTTEIRVPLTVAELDEKLADLQERFDKGLDLYAELLSGPRYYSDLTYNEKSSVDLYAQREGITSPDQVQKISVARLELTLED